MTTFQPFEGPYSNHIGGAFTHLETGVVYVLVTWRDTKPNAPYMLQVWELPPPYTTLRKAVDWPEDPWGYGTQTWLPDGSLCVFAPGNVDGGGVKPSFHIEPGVFPPIALAQRVTELEKHIDVLTQRLAALPPTTTGSVVYIPAQAPPVEGGEIQLADGVGGAWVIDIFHGRMRRFHRDAQGVVTGLEWLTA